MLQIKNISKKYVTENLVQTALDDVNLNLRDNEFVAVLGPSGSGKTTLLNIIGGLDRYDSGDLIINSISTKEYSDRDWDSYRNHTVGFVFQSYNLIPHQSVLANVELALTISGVSRSERRKRAADALEKVGLGDQLHKKPNKMSGGQMQRVAIARALVNDPDILLADEPTGALDTATSVQVMELLEEVAKDRLVVMVTHNPELADKYATRIVELCDGRITADSDPYEADSTAMAPPEHRNMGRAAMSFGTAIALSFNNLRTKKARTLLTAFAGSIGIIGIALILSLSNGINNYIDSIEEDTLSEYPVQIQSTGFNFASLMTEGTESLSEENDSDDVSVTEMISTMLSKMDNNDLASLRTYLESGESDIWDYAKAIEYLYDIEPQIYMQDDGDVHQVNPSVLSGTSYSSYSSYSDISSLSSIMSMVTGMNLFYEMPENEKLYEDQYDVKAGRWPESYDECVLVLTSNGTISDMVLYTLGLEDYQEYEDMLEQYYSGEDVETSEIDGSYDYEDILGITFKLVNSTDYYEYDSEYGIWVDKTDDDEYMEKIVDEGEDIKIVGIVQPSEDAASQALTSGINYPSSLIEHIVEIAEDSEIVQSQLENPDIDVFTGEKFGEESDSFDMSSLYNIDASALTSAINISDMTGALSDSLDMSSILQSIDLSYNASSDDLNELASTLMEGYQTYAKNNNLADYNDLTEDFEAYLGSSEAQSIISDFIVDTIEDSNAISISTDSIDTLLKNVLEDYSKYVSEQTDPTSVTTDAYLATGRAQNIFDEWAQENIKISDNISIDTASLNTLSSELVSGYSSYAAANGLTDAESISDGFLEYLATDEAEQAITAGLSDMADTAGVQEQLITSMEAATAEVLEKMTASLTDMMSIDGDALLEALGISMDSDDLAEILSSLSSSSTSSYEDNLEKMGYADFDNPSEIDIYPYDFESKDGVVAILDDYNKRMENAGEDEKVITYTDTVGTMMSSVTTIINVISYALMAFVSVSLIVSSIMIGIITYVSVLERTREIGILRAIGASKGNISQIFNAETFIIGLSSGLIGIIISLLLLIPGNVVIHALAGTTDVSAALPVVSGIMLVILSIVLSLIAGLIPSRQAAKKDPVTALRTE